MTHAPRHRGGVGRHGPDSAKCLRPVPPTQVPRMPEAAVGALPEHVDVADAPGDRVRRGAQWPVTQRLRPVPPAQIPRMPQVAVGSLPEDVDMARAPGDGIGVGGHRPGSAEELGTVPAVAVPHVPEPVVGAPPEDVEVAVPPGDGVGRAPHRRPAELGRTRPDLGRDEGEVVSGAGDTGPTAGGDCDVNGPRGRGCRGGGDRHRRGNREASGCHGAELDPGGAAEPAPGDGHRGPSRSRPDVGGHAAHGGSGGA